MSFVLREKNKIYRDLTWRLFTHFSSQFGKQKENRKITLQLRINTNSTYLFQKSHTICRLLFIIIFTAKSPKIAKKKHKSPYEINCAGRLLCKNTIYNLLANKFLKKKCFEVKNQFFEKITFAFF